jgi:hypothetical protein
MMGRWKKEGNHSPPNNKLVQEPEGSEKKPEAQIQTPMKQG